MTRIKVSALPEAMRKARKRRIKLNIQRRNFGVKSKEDRFKMIIREPDQFHAAAMFAQLTHEDALEFIRANYRGFTVKHTVTQIDALDFVRIRLVPAGFNLDVSPIIRGKHFTTTLARYTDRPTPEQILHKIQHHLPTVRII